MSSRLAMLFVVGYSNGQRSLTIIQKKKLLSRLWLNPNTCQFVCVRIVNFLLILIYKEREWLFLTI